MLYIEVPDSLQAKIAAMATLAEQYLRKCSSDHHFETPLDQAEMDFENAGGEVFIFPS
jgi:hypothetical protein